jgi:hypothetical protein
MLDWMNPYAFLQTVIKIFVVWIAFYGAGYLVENYTRIKKLFPLLPREISGILLLIIIELPLSIFGIMNRIIVPALLLIFAIPGILVLFGKLKNSRKPSGISITGTAWALAFLAVATINLTRASMPNLTFDDPLITYAVQPDKWLNNGRIYWLEETAFSGFPLTYEMMAVWPASLSSDRMNQLSVLQVFQTMLLFIALFRGMQTIQVRKKLWFPTATIVLLCTMLYYWSSLAKTDTAAILFCTLALSSAVREHKSRISAPYSSWFFMGLALATKQTALLILIPFVLYNSYRFYTSSVKSKAVSLLCISLIPAVFAARTMTHTGSPTYPVHQITSMVKDEWKLLPEPEEIIDINNRSSEQYSDMSDYSVFKHIGVFVLSMEGILLLLVFGLGIVLSSKSHDWLLFLPVPAFFAVAIIVLWPPWWGAKYSILIYPFVAILGVNLMQRNAKFTSVALPAIAIISFIVPGFIIAPNAVLPASYRYTVAKSTITGNWDTESVYKPFPSTAEGMTHMWLNSALPAGSKVLSLHEEKRYFFDGEVYVGWRHPATLPLYLNNSLEEECSVLDNIGIDYVTFYRNNPCIAEMENRLVILDHIGQGDILEPVISVSGNYIVCRYNSPSLL